MAKLEIRTLRVVLHAEVRVRPSSRVDAVARAQLDRAGVVVLCNVEQAAVEVVDVACSVHVRRGGRYGGGPRDRAGGKCRGGEVGGGVDVHGVATAADLPCAAGASEVAVCGEALANVEGVAAKALIDVFDAKVGVRPGGTVVAVGGAIFDAGDAEVIWAVDRARAAEVCIAGAEVVMLERLVGEDAVGFEDSVVGKLLTVEELPVIGLMAALRVVVIVSVTVVVGAGQLALALALDEDELGILEDKRLELDNEGLNDTEDVGVELLGETIEVDILNDEEDGATKVDKLDDDEKILLMLEVVVPPLLSYPPHTSDGLLVHGSMGPLDVVASLSRAEPQKHWSPACTTVGVALELDEDVEADADSEITALELLDDDETELEELVLDVELADVELADEDELGAGGKKVVVGSVVDTICARQIHLSGT
ncbi:hypothetical protein MMC11_007898 [Xylographa trunciseda]|nr:hypothetical protein [Xylographa trunciseda]